MFHRSHVLPSKLILPLVLALLLNSSLLAVPHLTPAVQAQAQQLTLEVVGPTYVRAGQNITYELILQNLSSQLFTNIVLYNYVPANTTHVSGGTLLIDDNSGLPFVSLTLPSLAAHATQTVSWVTKANAGLAVGTSIDNDGFGFIETTPGAAIGLYAGVSTVSSQYSAV